MKMLIRNKLLKTITIKNVKNGENTVNNENIDNTKRGDNTEKNENLIILKAN